MKGEIQGTRRVDSAVNDPFSGSLYITVTGVNENQPGPEPTASAVALEGGVDPALPDAADLQQAADLVNQVEGPVALNIVGYLTDASNADTAAATTNFVGSYGAVDSVP